jgi:hypothetical protein
VGGHFQEQFENFAIDGSSQGGSFFRRTVDGFLFLEQQQPSVDLAFV